MTAFPGGITVPVTLDLTAAYAAYTQFLAYIAQNPPIIFPQVNYQYAGGGGGGTTYVYNYNYTTNNYNTTRNITSNRGGGRGGRGRGGGGGRRRGYGGFGRYLRGIFLFHEATRLLQDAGNYAVASGGATGPQSQLRAEESLQRSLYSLPLVGPVASVLTLPDRIQNAQLEQAAKQQEDLVAGMRQALDFGRGLSERANVSELGPTDAARRQEVEDHAEGERRKVAQEAAKREQESAAERQRAFSAAHTKSFFGFFAEQEEADQQQALADERKRHGSIVADEHRNREAVERERTAKLKEIQYQEEHSLTEAKQRTQVAEAQYNLQPDVARADQTYFSGINAVEAARHRGRIPEALEDARATRFRLLAEQRELLNSGRAVEAENPSALAFSAADAAGHISEETKRDDLAEALQELSGNLLPKIDQLIAELQGI